MTSESSGQRLIRELSSDLQPVRRVPALRTSLLMVVGVAAVLAAFALISDGPRAGLLRDLLELNGYGGVFAGLLAAGLGGTAAALASGVPGRETAVRAGAAVALAGLGGALLLALFGALSLGFENGPSLDDDFHCVQRAMGFGVLPGALLGVLVLKGWVGRPLRAAAIALIGAVALGAAVAHLGCDLTNPRHLLLGHTGPPVVLALVGAWPLAALLRRFAR